MNATLLFILSLSVVFPLLVGIIRGPVLRPRYSPLIVLFLLALCAELFTRNSLLARNMSWVKINNLYILAESILIPLQFFTWGYFLRKKSTLILTIILLVTVWTVTHFITGEFRHIQPYYRMFYSLVIVLLGINAINYLVIHENKNLILHPVFIICSAFIIFFTYQIVYEGIYSIVTNLSVVATANLNSAFSIINCSCNLLYGIALLLVPGKSLAERWLRKHNLS